MKESIAMSGICRFVAAVLVGGLAGLCCGSPRISAAMDAMDWLEMQECKEEEGQETLGDVPIYYRQLQDYCTATDAEEDEDKPVLFQYVVQRGDSLYEIGKQFGTDVSTLVRLNNIANPHLIHTGDVLEVLTTVGYVHDVLEGDTVSSIAKLYGVAEEVIMVANSLENEVFLERGERVIVPGGTANRGVFAPLFQWPLDGRLTSGYGWRSGSFHYGIDIAAPLETPFYSASGGQVTHAGYLGAYGIMVEVDHGGGYRSRYAHASSAAVSVGQHVAAGQVIGYIGVTGNTTGPHLHFEILLNGEKLNPMKFLP